MAHDKGDYILSQVLLRVTHFIICSSCLACSSSSSISVTSFNKSEHNCCQSHLNRVWFPTAHFSRSLFSAGRSLRGCQMLNPSVSHIIYSTEEQALPVMATAPIACCWQAALGHFPSLPWERSDSTSLEPQPKSSSASPSFTDGEDEERRGLRSHTVSGRVRNRTQAAWLLVQGSDH